MVEWCHDWAEGFHGALTPDLDAVTDPMGPVEQDPLLYKEIRDGIFYRTFTALTVGSRLRGFRVVRTVE